MSTIRTARLRARLTLNEVASAMNRTGQWLAFCETDRINVSRALEAHILNTIATLAAFNQTTRANRARLVEHLQLPAQFSGAIR
jgi:hypothetical protein